MTTITATPKQIAFATRLLNEKNHGWDTQQMIDTLPAMGKRSVSALIHSLLAMPDTQTRPEATPGYYIVSDDEVYVVVENKAKTHTYAKRLTQTGTRDGRTMFTWAYAAGAGHRLAESQPLTVEAAAALGHLHGTCIIYRRALTDPASVERGIGPVCAANL